MKKLILLLTLVAVSFSADKWGVGKPANEGYILYPTISYTITNGELSYYSDNEIVELDIWTDDGGKFGRQINIDIILPITKHISFIYNSLKVAKHQTFYHKEFAQTRQSSVDGTNKQESWKKSTLGIMVSFSPDMFK